LAVMFTFSGALEPLKSSASSPPWPSTVSLPSPGSHWKRSSPLPSVAASAPMLPSTSSSPEPPRNVSAASLPWSVSLPAPPSMVIALSLAPPPLIYSVPSLTCAS